MKWVKKHKVLTVVLVFFGLVIIGAAVGGSSETANKQSADKAPAASQSSQTGQPKAPAWDAQAVYDKINAGMTKAETEQVIGKTSNDCSKTSIQGYGETEYCNYSGGFGSKGTITVTYHDGVVETKSKLDF
jgi:hypothetical protein